MDGLVLLPPIGFLAASWIIGRTIERRHYDSIRLREQATRLHPAVTFETVPEDRAVARTALAMGAVVVSADYFRHFVMGFRKIVGGEMRAYSAVIDRARREAILRMKESCPGANMYLNCRFQTTELGSARGNQIPIVELIAYSTAVFFAGDPDEVRPAGPG